MKVAREHFESLMNFSPAFAWITDAQGNILFVNDAYCKAFNLKREEIRNKSVFEIYPKSIAEEYQRNIETVVKSNQPLNTIESGVLADGTHASFMICKFPLETIDGQKRVGGWAVDVTENQKHSEQLSIQSKLLDTIQQAAIVTDRDGIIQYWNKFAEQLYGWTRDETIGKFILDFIPVTEQKLGADIMKEVRMGNGWNGEMLLHNKTGKLFSAYLIASPLSIADNEVRGVISVSMDISERKISEEKLLHQSKTLREISFIQSHEVRRPLSNILALADLMENCSVSEYPELIARMKESAVHLDTVIKTLVWKAVSEAH